ncbi:VCBS domain-containing protein, partial [Mesorhizobium sp. CA4]|uniref:VCBS domain-containing protein n=1 Tax=Mesorhizobium sp. CA4 TaxID=588499 RepID=UPI001CD15F9E
MATTQISGAGGTTVSFSNTPQAQNDVFYFSEDSTGTLVLNVLSNDLGGAAKQLYSIDNADSATTSTKTYAPADLLIRDTAYSTDAAVPVATADTSYLGARIWISTDGTIHYDKTSIDSKIQALGAGQVLIDKLTYAIQLGNGTLSWATATIQFTGTNDAAVIGTPTVADVTEDTPNSAAVTLSATGTISISDIDTGEAHFQTSVSGAAGNLGGLVLAADGSYTYSVANAAVQFLGAGATHVDTFTVTAADGTTKDVSFTIHGTNDAAVIGTPTVADVTEDTPNSAA